MSHLLRAVRTWGGMVRFSHSIFALPFALSGAAIAASEVGVGLHQVLWVVVAMICARNAAMGFNRLADHELDARNPRTADRALPRRRLTRKAAWAFTGILSVGFVVASSLLGRLCGLLSPLALVIIFGYSYTKRFTWLSHVFLGLALAIAPVGGWLAVRGEFSSVAWLLGLAVLLWVAGFDVIYACQDVDFDRQVGLASIPVRFGVGTALRVSRWLHGAALIALAGVGVAAGLHPVYWIGWGVIVSLIVWEHRLVREQDLSRLGMAFFNMNGVIAMVYLVAVLTALALPRLGGST